MSLVRRKVEDVIRRAYDVLGLLGENEEMTGYQSELGLDLLNTVLDSFASGGLGVPFYTEFSFTMAQSYREYKIAPELPANPEPNMVLGNRLVELVTVQLQQGDIKYPVRVNDLNSVETHDTVTNSQGRPEVCALTRWIDDGSMSVPFSRITFYPFPDQAYTAFIRAKSYVNYVSLNDVMNEIPASMHLYLSYELAFNLLNFYESANWTPQKDAKYRELKANFDHGQDLDMTLQNTGMLNRNGRFYTRRLTSG